MASRPDSPSQPARRDHDEHPDDRALDRLADRGPSRVGIDGARFRRPVVPGDQLILKAQFVRAMRGIWKFSTSAEVEGVEVCCADMMVAPEAKG